MRMKFQMKYVSCFEIFDLFCLDYMWLPDRIRSILNQNYEHKVKITNTKTIFKHYFCNGAGYEQSCPNKLFYTVIITIIYVN